MRSRSSPAPAMDGGFRSAQPHVNDEPDRTDGDHPRHYRRGADAALPLDDEVADAARGDDQLGTDQRLPAETRADAQPRDDRGYRGRQQHFDDDAPSASPQGLRRLDHLWLDKLGAAIGGDERRRG